MCQKIQKYSLKNAKCKNNPPKLAVYRQYIDAKFSKTFQKLYKNYLASLKYTLNIRWVNNVSPHFVLHCREIIPFF